MPCYKNWTDAHPIAPNMGSVQPQAASVTRIGLDQIAVELLASAFSTVLLMETAKMELVTAIRTFSVEAATAW